MGWLSKLRESLAPIAETLGAEGLVGRIKDAIQGRAAEAPYAVEPPKSVFESYMDAWKQADYRSMVVPNLPELVYEQPSVLSRAQYAPGPEGMRSQYITAFEGAGFNPETGDYESFSFGIGHDELLTEEDVAEAADAFASDYGLESAEAWDVIGGITSNPTEEYLEL